MPGLHFVDEQMCHLAIRIQELGLFVGRALGRELCGLSQTDGRDAQNRPNETTQNRTGGNRES